MNYEDIDEVLNSNSSEAYLKQTNPLKSSMASLSIPFLPWLITIFLAIRLVSGMQTKTGAKNALLDKHQTYE
jgi:ABC-type transport system involved in multi-copper enzyme maturation permease subunit